MPPLLYLLALGNLVVGSSAFVTSGLVLLIAEGLNTSVTAAGLAMTAYALSTALFAPMLVVATGRWQHKRALLVGLALFTLGNALCALSTSIGQLYGGRVLMGLGSMFTPLAAGVALALVTPERRGKALSTVFLGMSLSYVVGVPLGAWMGLQHGWQSALWLMTAASALMLLLAAWRLPAQVQAPGASFAGLGAVLKRADVLTVLVTTLLYFAAIFTVFSYIQPVLAALAPAHTGWLSATLGIFGLSGVAGTLIGGVAADRFGARRTMQVLLASLGMMMLLLPFTVGSYPLMLAVLVLWGGSGFGLMAPQQSRLAQLAPQQAPLLLSLNSSMLYFGTALGAAIGGPASAVVGFSQLPWVAAPLAATAWALLMLGGRRAGTGLATATAAPK
ncbi:MAG: MFS transporter [Rubrivivax sp.]|nr:MFS transporter [Rubrivivax sp.]